ncbi:MAG: dTDP-4-dehydrorhamnose 3,5-epimerase [Desulfocapsaceae bacterium]|nr:dTDP-4-dehydrorhamnose 3,5-epimerase [Desulfocapsaceae bacterium]
MKVTATSIADVLIIEPKVFGDERGFFFESFNLQDWQAQTGLSTQFVQHNHSRSSQGVLRGLHYQIRQPQGKLIRAVVGKVFDVAVDLRRNSETFGKWVGEYLSAENKKSLWVPEGFAHGFYVVSDVAEIVYAATDFYAPEHERCICYNDSDLDITWPLDGEPTVSDKDKDGRPFRTAEVYTG